MKIFLEQQLERTNYWLSFAETKNGVLVAFNIAIIAVVAQIDKIPLEMQAVICILFSLSTLICFFSFFSNLRNKINNKEGENIDEFNLLFYNDIALCYNKKKRSPHLRDAGSAKAYGTIRAGCRPRGYAPSPPVRTAGLPPRWRTTRGRGFRRGQHRRSPTYRTAMTAKSASPRPEPPKGALRFSSTARRRPYRSTPRALSRRR